MSLRGFSTVLFSLISALALSAAKPAAPAPAAYKGAIVIDAATGQTLFEDNPDIVSPPASVTKLMTFLVVHDQLQAGKLSLQTPITVTAEAAKTGGSQVYLAEKEVFPVEDLLYALMISSANDAATALAIHIAGSKEAFVTLMNTRARDLGMKQTTFRSPHGLPPATRKLADSDLTTPRDLATLSLYLVKHTSVLTYTSVEKRVFRPGPKRIDMDNHNNLLGKLAGVDGLKTGFTNGAGFCLAATALRDGRRVIAVTMGSPASKTRDLRMAELIAEGFAKMPASSRFEPDSPFVSNSPVTPSAPSTATPPAAASKPTPNAPAPTPSTPATPPPAEKPAEAPSVFFPKVAPRRS